MCGGLGRETGIDPLLFRVAFVMASFVGGAGMIIGHLELADDVHVSAGTMVTKNLTKPGQYTSIYPLEAHEDWLRNAAQLKRLSKLADRVTALERSLEKKLEDMEKNN